MNTAWRSIVPGSKQEAVEKALRQAFGSSSLRDILLLQGGLSSALVYRIVSGKRTYVLRIIMQTDTLNDPVRQFACMQTAAEAGIAPQVRYANAEDAVSITDYIAPYDLVSHFSSQHALLSELVRTIRAIHALPLFAPLVDFMDGVDVFIQYFRQLNMLPEEATAEHFRYYAEIQRAYPRHETGLVSSHNDLNPNNILFDGKKIWVIDWETAFRNDRYVDLAIIGKSFVHTHSQEEHLLRKYFGDALSDYNRARYFLMQQVCHIYYATIMLRQAAAIKPDDFTHEKSMKTPSMHTFNRLKKDNKISLSSYEGKLLYGKILLNEALYNMKTARFASAIQAIS
jgi:thiamine kinase-like enzyme